MRRSASTTSPFVVTLTTVVKPDDDREIAPLPAIVVGYRVDADVEAGLRQLEEVPPWLVWWEHQYGGLATEHVQLAGALAPLAHAPATRGPRSPVVEGLAALGCGGRRDPEIRRFPELKHLHLTFGKPYDVSDIDVLATLLAKGFDLPPIELAHEAFVELAPCDLVRHFGGWPVLAHEIPRRSHLADPDAYFLVIGDRAVRDERQLDGRLIAGIAACGARLGASGPPRAFLVWGNSD